MNLMKPAEILASLRETRLSPQVLVAALGWAALTACQEDDCLETKRCAPPSEPAASGGSDPGATGGAPSEPLEPGAGGIEAGGSVEPAGAGSAGAPFEPEGTTEGARCTDEDDRACAGPASDTVLECRDGRWALAEVCSSGALCDSSEPGCAPIAPGCERLTPGDAFCEDRELVTCGPDLVTVERELCEGRCGGDGCIAPDCGDGIVQEDEEECDDGNDDDTDECISSCKIAVCGDGRVFVGTEECDDGNDDDTDACSSKCEIAVCGDGVVREGVEECDDANRIETDGCLSDCKRVVCGDGVVAGAEQCDDGDDDDTDACPTNCEDAVCGDGFVLSGVEQCDDGNSDSGDGCSSYCLAEPVQLALGAAHTCAVLGDGRLKCWGNNEYGQAGPGDDSKVGDAPGELGRELAAVLNRTSAVAAGDSHTCAIRDGSVMCWGDNSAGQLGPLASSSTSAKPVRVSLDNDPPSDPTHLCAAGTVSAVLLQDGSVYTWGTAPLNPSGQPMKLDFPGAPRPPLSLSCGDRLICARYPEGAYCWGSYPEREPGVREADLLQPITDLAAGGEHACALNAEGELLCFGWNSPGAALIQDPPTLFAWPDREALSTSKIGGVGVAVAAGGSSTCVVFEGGSLKCWGEDVAGNLGQPALRQVDPFVGDNPEEFGSSLPAIDLGFGLIVKSVATSGNHTCALFTSGRLKCWGLNDSGQLGIGTTESMGDDFGEMGAALSYVPLD